MGPRGALLLTGGLIGLAVYLGTRPAQPRPLPVSTTSGVQLEAGPILRQINTSNTTTPGPSSYLHQQAAGLI